MKKNSIKFLIIAVACGAWLINTKADPVLNFPFNEGSGNTTTDIVHGVVGVLGSAQDPAVDMVTLVDQSPSGQPNDRSIQTSGAGFLLADDSASQVLNITNGPITLESWIWIDPSTPAKTAEGTIAYGNSYKMGMRSGVQVFTLYGIVDILNNTAGPVPAGEWVHLAAAWEPGVGVHFFVNGQESFEANTNTAARPVSHNYLSLASEGLGNNSVAIFDRMRVHHALLTADQIDSDPTTPKAPLPTTLVSYNFNEQSLPAKNEVTPELPTILASTLLPVLTGPAWTNDTPSGAANDYALAFLTDNPPVKEVVTANYGDAPIDLSVNNNSYTLQSWVKLPTGPFEERRVIFRSNGSAPRIALSVNANRTLHTTVVGTADFTTSVPIPNDNRWHHIAVAMDNFTQLRFYLDGVLRQTVNRTQTGAPTAGGTPQLLIGKESETRYFRGILDRVIIDNSALDAAALDYPAVAGAPTFASFNDQPLPQVLESGSTATFTATPSSPTTAGYQWYYRTNLADQTGVPIEGATGTTLTLPNISAANEGFYYLVATNDVGRVESYAAELILRSSLALPSTGFEQPQYSSGELEGQSHWTTDANGAIARVLTSSQISDLLESSGITPGQTVHSGDQALVIGGANVASNTTRPVAGLENSSNATFDFWVRPLSGATTGNVFITAENAAGTRAAAVRFGPNNSIDYGTAITGVWQATGLTWNADSWYHITMKLNYADRTYDFLVNGTQVNTSPIPFYTATSDQLAQIRIFRGLGQAGVILDDLSVTGESTVESPTLSIQKQTGAVVISWPATSGNFILQATDELVPANWTEVPHTVVGGNNQATIQTTEPHQFFRLVQQ
jgi:hypothetical protein